MKVEPNRNVYVGHRYVPKIFGEWNNENEYMGLSIVTHQGTSYTSKKRVPVGIDILNEEFWVVTGNYNAQVEYYRDEVRDLQDHVDTELPLKADLTFVNTELDKKANSDYVNSELEKKAEKAYVDNELSDKVVGLKDEVNYTLPGDYPTLQAALDDIMLKHTNGVRVGITIQSGHQPILRTVLRDVILPNVVLYSQDDVVVIGDELSNSHNLFDLANSYGFQLSCLIDMNGTGSDGIYLQGSSYLRVNKGSGIINPGNNGLNVREGSTATAASSIFTGASQNSSDGAGITAWGGHVTAPYSDVSNSLAYGARAAHGGTLDFDSGIANDVAYHGIRASQNGSVACRYATVNNAGIHGIYALNASHINAEQSNIKGAGNTGLYASGASQINSDRTIIEECDIGCRAWYGSTINFNSGETLNCIDTGISCTLSSIIEARNVQVNGSQLNGIRADESSSVNAQSSTVYGSLGTGVRASNNSQINVRASTVRNTQPDSLNAHGVVSDSMSRILIQNGTSWNNGGNDLRVDAGGMIGANGCRTSSNVGSGMPSEPSTEDINISQFNNFSRLGYILD